MLRGGAHAVAEKAKNGRFAAFRDFFGRTPSGMTISHGASLRPRFSPHGVKGPLHCRKKAVVSAREKLQPESSTAANALDNAECRPSSGPFRGKPGRISAPSDGAIPMDGNDASSFFQSVCRHFFCCGVGRGILWILRNLRFFPKYRPTTQTIFLTSRDLVLASIITLKSIRPIETIGLCR